MANKKKSEYINILKDQYFEYEQLNKFFSLSADWICIAGFDGYFKKINPAVSNLLGYSEEELMSRPINEFVYTDDQQITSSSRTDIHKGKPLVNFENRYFTKSGEIVWLSWTSIPDPEREVVFAIGKNVTGKKRQEEERIIFTGNLARINEELKQFTRMTSHDIRSPVGNLMSIFSLLDVSKITDAETVELVGLLKRASEHLHDTVNNFVDLLIEKDKLDVSLENLSLGDCMNAVIDSIGSLITDSGAIIISDFSAYDAVLFNQSYLDSVFLNLITNSIKYSHMDRLPRILIATKIVNGVNQLTFSDNGLGFDLEKIGSKIFGLYQVFHNRSDSKGIGLHLVHNHIKALGGSITIESRVNIGTTFTISFK